MRYIITWKMKEPFEENYKKTMKIQKERIKKGESLGDKIIFPIHAFISENKAFMIVETDDPIDLAKWTISYQSYMDYHIQSIHEFSKIQNLFPE
jgi:hypothetical protein